MIIPPVERWIAGEQVDADLMQRRASDMLAFLLEPPMAAAKATVVQQITTGTWTKILLDTVIKDNDGIVDLTNDRLNIQTPGWYEIEVCTAYGTGNGNDTLGRRIAAARLNGSGANGGQRARRDCIPCTDAARGVRAGGSMTALFLNKGDYLELMGYQDSTTTKPTDVSATPGPGPYIAVRWVSN